MTFRLIAEFDSAKVEFFDPELRELAARHLAELVASSDGGDTLATSPKHRGRPSANKTITGPPADEQGVDRLSSMNGQT